MALDRPSPRSLPSDVLLPCSASSLSFAVVAKLPETILPIGTDAGMQVTYARMMLHGGRPYVDFYDIHPPLSSFYWMLVEVLAGSDWSRMCFGAWGSPLVPQHCISLVAHGFDLSLTFVTGEWCTRSLEAPACGRCSGCWLRSLWSRLRTNR